MEVIQRAIFIIRSICQSLENELEGVKARMNHEEIANAWASVANHGVQRSDVKMCEAGISGTW